MSIPAYLKPENGPLGRALGTWLDHAPAELASRFVLLWFVILYTAFAIISSASLGLHPDLLETYALGQHPAAGYAGHAPLAPWLAGAWFRLFPPTDWAFHLLAMVNAAAGLFAADRIARLYLDGDKRIAVLLLLLLTPFYQFIGQGFGAAETMLSTWPIATWCFLRAFATRDLAWSAAGGAAAALAVLGHYASVFLIAGFVVAVLAHPGRGAFLRSWAPWLAAAVGAIVLAPHLQWLYATGFASVSDAASQQPGAPVADALWNDLLYIAGSIAAVGVVIVVYALAVRPDRATLRDTFWPPDADGRTLVLLLSTPLALTFLLPFLAAPFAGGAPALPWPAASTWFLLPVVLLRPKAAALTRTAAIRITALVATATIATLAAAPWLAWRRHDEGTPEGREYYRLVGAEVTRAWRLATGLPLRIVAGDPGLASAVTFYSPDHPDAVPGFETSATPSVTPEQLARDGFAAICRADDETCVSAAKQRVAGKANVQFITYSTSNHYLGKPGRLGRFFFILALPESKPVIMLR
jgi:hypothetical protein